MYVQLKDNSGKIKVTYWYWACACGNSPIKTPTGRYFPTAEVATACGKPQRCDNSYHDIGREDLPMEIRLVKMERER